MTIRCASWARAEGLDPIGTAGSYAGFCCVEWPLPWPAALEDVPDLGDLAASCFANSFRLQGLVRAAGARTAEPGLEDRGRAIVWRCRPGEAFAGYEPLVLTGPPQAVLDGALAAVESSALESWSGAGSWALESSGAGASALREPAAQRSAADETQGAEPAVRRDVLVCAHGRRDMCCGARGTALVADLDTAGGFPPGTSLWRTSHTGGHRFAPTAIVLPEGTLWAYLEVETLRGIVARSGPVADVALLYRGCAGLATPGLQALERAVFLEVGWDLFDAQRIGTDDGAGDVCLDVAAGRETATWEAHAAPARNLSMPGCGSVFPGTAKPVEEWALTDLRRTR